MKAPGSDYHLVEKFRSFMLQWRAWPPMLVVRPRSRLYQPLAGFEIGKAHHGRWYAYVQLTDTTKWIRRYS